MLNPSFKGVLREGDSKYTLVMLIAKRARQLIDGAEPLIETESKKPVTIAIEEIVEGKIKYENPPADGIK
ncbi:MAG TPA: DNA-directed RNA polymerase subunit omega [Tissierellaceae bacterium]|nr:DNA-directed RNA polymerase subunit omega [Tissierellaceae bacterium]